MTSWPPLPPSTFALNTGASGKGMCLFIVTHSHGVLCLGYSCHWRKRRAWAVPNRVFAVPVIPDGEKWPSRPAWSFVGRAAAESGTRHDNGDQVLCCVTPGRSETRTPKAGPTRLWIPPRETKRGQTRCENAAREWGLPFLVSSLLRLCPRSRYTR